MERISNSKNNSDKEDQKASSTVDRRSFLMSAGIAASVGAAMVACSKDHEPGPDPVGTVDLGSGDVGVLNYAYALEQLEAAFYIQVIDTPYDGMSAAEKTILTDIRDHEIIHRDFFKAALTAAAPTAIIPSLEVNFSGINFKSRDIVLGAAKLFEDTGVAAYNGAGKLIKTADYLVLAGKIVSVEARHASVIGDLLKPNTENFAGGDVVDNNGLDKAIDPATILAAVKPYLKTNVTGANVGK
ncbi:ferritin-like domain-containing protein [Dyadobacter sp. CY312]|uniref:ferritin-like domain-containing protein n=1 Tax=Dyadobacter sp. CY312 TaxID=2907303 RepID=UPI001F46F1FC|nr:ferritin-like domain-containing protein [Dyadobacter sp. CY312]MCE7041929.1 ferritin-like domain-containing protein [Dyadobacter sp. CY312]